VAESAKDGELTGLQPIAASGQCMDTYRTGVYKGWWERGEAPWKGLGVNPSGVPRNVMVTGCTGFLGGWWSR